MIRINVTAQIWFLNELPYHLDLSVLENNYEYPTLKIGSSIANYDLTIGGDVPPGGAERKIKFIRKLNSKDSMREYFTYKKYVNFVRKD
jgi:hypothetical protein